MATSVPTESMFDSLLGRMTGFDVVTLSTLVIFLVAMVYLVLKERKGTERSVMLCIKAIKQMAFVMIGVRTFMFIVQVFERYFPAN